MEEKPRKRIGELLIEDGALSREQLNEALEVQKKHGGLIGQILISHGYITEENLTAALGRQLDIPYLSVAHYALNLDAVGLMHDDFCRRNFLLIFDQDDHRVFVAIADPLNHIALQEIEKQVKKQQQIFISTPTEIITALDKIAIGAKKEMKKAV